MIALGPEKISEQNPTWSHLLFWYQFICNYSLCLWLWWTPVLGALASWTGLPAGEVHGALGSNTLPWLGALSSWSGLPARGAQGSKLATCQCRRIPGSWSQDPPSLAYGMRGSEAPSHNRASDPIIEAKGSMCSLRWEPPISWPSLSLWSIW